MFIVGKSFFSEILSKLNIKTIAPLCIIHIPYPIKNASHRTVRSTILLIVCMYDSYYSVPASSYCHKSFQILQRRDLNEIIRVVSLLISYITDLIKYKLGVILCLKYWSQHVQRDQINIEQYQLAKYLLIAFYSWICSGRVGNQISAF